MTNARIEFEELVNEAKRTPICALITYRNDKHVLKVGYTDLDYEDFLQSLNFGYNSGYGRQYLDGVIWFEGSVWAERGEYDGSEWWELRQYPKFPLECK